MNPAPAARTIQGVADWLHGLPVFWLAAFVFGVAVLVTAAAAATTAFAQPFLHAAFIRM